MIRTLSLFGEDHPDLVAHFCLRHGGVSTPPYESLNLGLSSGDEPASVVENRRRVGDHLGVPLDRWTVVGQVALAWFGTSTVTDPARPAAFQVITDDNGGWGLGELYDAEDTLTLTTCWSPVGDTVYAEGTALDPDLGAQIEATGTDGDCPTAYPF